jgi:hypothetical protein
MCLSPSGTWAIVDESGLERTVSVHTSTQSTTRVVFETDFDVALYHDGGAGSLAIIGAGHEVRGTIPAGLVIFADDAGDCVDGVRTIVGFHGAGIFVPMLDPIGAWAAMGPTGQNLVLDNPIDIRFSVVDPGSPNPAQITMDFDVTNITGKPLAGAVPGYNVKHADIVPYSGVNLNETFMRSVSSHRSRRRGGR